MAEDALVAVEKLRSVLSMPKTPPLEMPALSNLGRLRFPPGVQRRFNELLERQNKGPKLTARERREAEGLVEMAEWISLLKLRARRASKAV